MNQWRFAAIWTRDLKGALEGSEYRWRWRRCHPRFAASPRRTESAVNGASLDGSDGGGDERSLEALWSPTLGPPVEGTKIGQVELSLQFLGPVPAPS